MNTLDRGIALHTSRALANHAPTFSVQHETWREAAVCASVDPDLFHLEKGGNSTPAKRVCAGCPVREACGQDAMTREGDADRSARFGIFGGLTPRDRGRLWVAGWQLGDPIPAAVPLRGAA